MENKIINSLSKENHDLVKSMNCIAMDNIVSMKEATERADALADSVGWAKVGITASINIELEMIQMLMNKGYSVFLDLKFHDIPNTVKLAVYEATKLGVKLINVHASGGSEMMKRAKEAALQAARDFNVEVPILIAVTVLTSMKDSDLREQGIEQTVTERVDILANLTKDSGLDGIVCSGKEIELMLATYGANFKLITPGIRPEGAASNDQHRIVTPTESITKGTFLNVIGRPLFEKNGQKLSFKEIKQAGINLYEETYYALLKQSRLAA